MKIDQYRGFGFYVTNIVSGSLVSAKGPGYYSRLDPYGFAEKVKDGVILMYDSNCNTTLEIQNPSHLSLTKDLINHFIKNYEMNN